MINRFTPTRMTIIKKADNKKSWWGCRKTENLLWCWWECKTAQLLWTRLAMSQMVTHELPYDAAILPLGIVDHWTTRVWTVWVHLTCGFLSINTHCSPLHDMRLNPWMWNRGYGGRIVKFLVDFQLWGGYNPCLVRASVVYPREMKTRQCKNLCSWSLQPKSGNYPGLLIGKWLKTKCDVSLQWNIIQQ